MGSISDALIHEAAQRLGRAARKPAQVILFGSYATGGAAADSEVDFFLVVQQDGFSRGSETVRLQDALGPFRAPAEVLVVTHEEAARPERTGDAVRDALLEGVVLYESA